MKLKKLTIEGFRGIPKSLELDLAGKSLCLLGESGLGKTTIVDGLEYWSRGELDAFKAAGCGLDATINLDHGPPASVTCERQGQGTLRRVLNGAGAEPLEVVGPAPVDQSLPPELPLLRHSTMTQFMSSTPFAKKQALLRVLGLEPLLEFRAALVTATNNARRVAAEAEARLAEETRSMEAETGGSTIVARAEGLRVTARLAQPITSDDELIRLSLATTPAVTTRVNRSDLVARVGQATNALRDSAVTRWNAVCTDHEAAAADAVRTMISAGQRVLALWSDRTCPLCLAAVDPAELEAALGQRAADLAELHERFNGARTEVLAHVAAEVNVAAAIEALLGSPPPDGWPDAKRLRRLGQDLRAHFETAGRLVAAASQCPAAPTVDLSAVLSALRAAAMSPAHEEDAAALAQLVSLRGALIRVRNAESKARANREVADGVDCLRELAEATIADAVKAAVGRLGEVAADFYVRLIRNRVYTDVKLDYSERGKGGIEFSLTFNRTHTVSPPQRIVSESQLNALGLAFFLARLKVEETPWRTLVLDDVVDSFGANFRMGLARLLTEEFAAWQILFFTHDTIFVSIARECFSGWRFWQIVGWSPTDGPVIDNEDPLKRLAARLEKGEAASDLGGLARFALERGLSTPLEKLRLPIRFSRHGLYSARDYRDALEKGLRDRGSSLKDLQVIRRMKAANYLTNLSAHDRQAAPPLSTEDLHQMVDDLHELAKAFVCPDCGRPVWDNHSTKEFDKFQCRCAKLAV